MSKPTTSEDFETHLFSYQYEGSSWVLEIKAESPEDARRRIARLQSATYDGVLVAKVSIPESLHKVSSVLRSLWRAIFGGRA